MARKGRKFELLTSAIESSELPNNAIVTSPKYFIDKDT